MNILITLLTLLYSTVAYADVMSLKSINNNSYLEPVYFYEFSVIRETGSSIVSIAREDDFPYSSDVQGSIFIKAFNKFAIKEGIHIKFYYPKDQRDAVLEKFEHKNFAKNSNINASFGNYFETIKYSSNEYMYPSFYKRKIYYLTRADSDLSINDSSDLAKYNGAYVKSENFSSFVIKQINELNIKPFSSYDIAFKQLLTGKIDYIVADYYQSQIALYKLGLRDFILYSKDHVWESPIFFRITPDLVGSKRIKALVSFLNSNEYKEEVENAFEELMEIYQENTRGIVPPTYLNIEQTIIEEEEEYVTTNS